LRIVDNDANEILLEEVSNEELKTILEHLQKDIEIIIPGSFFSTSIR